MKQLIFCACVFTYSCFAYGAASRQDPSVMKETFRNSYGIIVSGQDWNKRGCDGTITKVLKDGSTLHEVYSQGLLHGEITLTFPHSTVLSVTKTYQHGRLLASKTFFPNGLPSQEEIFREDGSHVFTKWPDNNDNDTITEPYFVETTYQGRILEGTYSSFNGKYTSSIRNGEGIRSTFSPNNVLLSEETFNDGVLTKVTTFYPNRDPQSITHYVDDQIHGLRFTYLPGGIPNTIEEWRHSQQDGTTIIFKNGCKVAEIPFVKGAKHGLELRYNEENSIAEEVTWKNNHLHGMRKIYAAGVYKCEWYHRGRLVSKAKFERLNTAG
ncbi:MORN repeat variant family protein [Chlamydia ibidis]|uniref:MORN repeat variant family protein n=2 Tax=Chlamydia ibidis TaxID=1405396 RepID=S7J4W3_9CHLA|nr:toxin-antitoxin system YwqK family antitoxin [Chlamydia ibidis]EPP35459.1 MORN repeat variant family protein [Chlamydia ibidis]EQM63209.1 MORN repeat variant family protein [Chlamydia ibidis 10-1398/6]